MALSQNGAGMIECISIHRTCVRNMQRMNRTHLIRAVPVRVIDESMGCPTLQLNMVVVVVVVEFCCVYTLLVVSVVHKKNNL